MRSKIVLWGANAQDEKVLLGIQLRAKDSIVEIYQFPEAIATEEFYNDLLHKWRSGQEVAFPEGHVKIERPLNMTDSILPEDIKVDRTDVIQRAQTEWHFVVLGDKLYEMYKGELNDLKEKVEKLNSYDSSIWNDLKGFWKKIQEQSRARTLFHKHANDLRDETNTLFNKLKEMRKVLDAEFEKASKTVKVELESTLEDIEKRIEKGMGLKPIFEDLKKIQQKFKGAKFVRKDREAIWNRIDTAFKAVKAKRFGDNNEGDNSKLSRVQRRLDGMVGAIERMERSIRRDKKEIEFQKMKIGTTDGQLEAQIRAAKLKMLEDRITSKDVKFKDMLETQEKLTATLQREKDHAEKIAKREVAKKEAEERIKQEMANNAVHSDAEEAKLKEAAEKIKEAAESRKKKQAENKAKQEETRSKIDEEAPKKESLIDAIGVTLGESLGDVVDTIKAVAEIVADRVEDVVDDVSDQVGEVVKEAAQKVEEVVEEMKASRQEEE